MLSRVLLDDGKLRELLIGIKCATLRQKRRVQRHRRISPTQYQHEDKGAFSISRLVQHTHSPSRAITCHRFEDKGSVGMIDNQVISGGTLDHEVSSSYRPISTVGMMIYLKSYIDHSSALWPLIQPVSVLDLSGITWDALLQQEHKHRHTSHYRQQRPERVVRSEMLSRGVSSRYELLYSISTHADVDQGHRRTPRSPFQRGF